MPEISARELTELRRIATRLLDAVDKLEGVQVHVPDDVKAHVRKCLENRICLCCGAKVPKSVKIVRGQEAACYSTTRKRIRAGEVREIDLIQVGKLTAEPSPPGRPPRRELTPEQLRVVAEDMERYNRRTSGDKEV